MIKFLTKYTQHFNIGASLKDLGKKWFAFSKMDIDTLAILEKVVAYE